MKTIVHTYPNGKKETLCENKCSHCNIIKFVKKYRIGQKCQRCAGKLVGKNNKGNIGPNLGKTFDSETRLKMSKAKLGISTWNAGRSNVYSHESRLKMSKAKLGKIPWNKSNNISGVITNDKLKARYRHKLRKAVKGLITYDFAPYIGCIDSNTLRQYIQSQFKPGMSWDNYGIKGWHLDHVVPLKYFNLCIDEELKIACNYKNIQPMWSSENLSKHKRIVYLLTGTPASGKSWVCSKLKDTLDPIDLDIVRLSNLHNVLKTTYRPIIAMTIGVSTFIKNNPNLDIKLIVINENESIIRERLHMRQGKFNETIVRRMRRMVSLSKSCEFSGTSLEVLNYLNNINF